MTPENYNKIMKKALDIECAFSPENLSCDGEASEDHIASKIKQLKKEWKTLEMQLGRKIESEEVWNWDKTKRNTVPKVKF